MKLKLILSKSVNPYENLALEQVIMNRCEEDTLYFYLWQNAHTVVIGKHQHAYSEVFVEKALKEGVKIARRSSGGGAVYHDLGNLNFTFIAKDPLYSIQKQMQMIENALIDLGYEAQVNGRNDIEVNGFKVSGNAFAHQGTTHLHHGTLLVDVNKAMLGQYLNVNPKKLQRKNVNSVAARIENLNNIQALNIKDLITHLFRAVENYAGVIAEHISAEAFMDEQMVQVYSDENYRLGLKNLDRFKFEECFDFGCIKWDFEAKDGIITHSKIYSDALENEWIEHLEQHVLGHPEQELKKVLLSFDSDYNDRRDALILALE